jgi:hypothetical protein
MAPWSDVRNLIDGTREIIGTLSVNRKAYLRPGAISVERQFRQLSRYLGQLKKERGAIVDEDINWDVITTIAPNCYVHLISVPGDARDAVYERWQILQGHRGSIDCTGQTLTDVNDDGLNQCYPEDINAVSSSGWSQLAAVSRTAIWPDFDEPQRISVLRYLCRIDGVDGCPKVISAARVQDSDSPFNFIDDLFLR